jgi:hypothetical protein
MSRDLSVAWELLAAVASARQQLSSARPRIWEAARLPTAESAILVKSSDNGRYHSSPAAPSDDEVMMRVSLETHLADGRRVNSCLDIVVGPQRWRAKPYITLAGKASEIIWEGKPSDRDDSSGFSEAVDTATQSLVKATMGLDFAAYGSNHHAEKSPEG